MSTLTITYVHSHASTPTISLCMQSRECLVCAQNLDETQRRPTDQVRSCFRTSAARIAVNFSTVQLVDIFHSAVQIGRYQLTGGDDDEDVELGSGAEEVVTLHFVRPASESAGCYQ